MIWFLVLNSIQTQFFNKCWHFNICKALWLCIIRIFKPARKKASENTKLKQKLAPKDKMVTQTLPPTFVQGFHDETIMKKMEFRKQIQLFLNFKLLTPFQKWLCYRITLCGWDFIETILFNLFAQIQSFKHFYNFFVHHMFDTTRRTWYSKSFVIISF